MAKSQSLLVSREKHEGSPPRVSEEGVDTLLDILSPLVGAIGETVGPHCEVVLHDLRVPERSIVAIANGVVTGRRVGGPVVGGPTRDIALKLLDSNVPDSTLSVGYRTHTRDGRELRSTSLILRTPEGKPAIALCINVDLSTLTMARLLLEEILKTAVAKADASADAAVGMDISEALEQVIREAMEEVGKPAKFMEREERLQAVRLMHERGLFLIRGGIERAATSLGISRFTLYSYLKEIRSS